MQITINGNDKQVSQHATVTDLFNLVAINPEQVVVEHNGSIISPADYDQTTLNDGDVIELIQFVGGG
ncbi:MAG: sulfur carrier protein ThiS [Pelovirga sp.]